MFHAARKTIVCILFLGILGISCTQLSLQSYFQGADKYTLVFDYVLAQETQHAITEFFKKACQNCAVSMDTLCVYIKNAFPYVRTINISLLPNRLMHVEIKAYKPQYIVNNTHALINNQLLVYKEIFIPRIIQTLYSVSLNLAEKNKKIIPQSVQACFARMKPSLLDRYNFYWHNAHYAWLHDKKYPYFALLFDEQLIPDVAIICHCNAIRQQLLDRGVFEKKDKKIWIADIRFADQIVVYARKRGGIDGTDMF